MYLQIKEDSYILYGFVDDVEWYLFIQLILVFGIGFNMVRIVLLLMNLDEVKVVIVLENVVVFKQVKGVGFKMVK